MTRGISLSLFFSPVSQSFSSAGCVEPLLLLTLHFAAGHLIVPEGVKVVFTDSGKGHIGGLDDIHLADGLYCVAHSLECFHTN
jgi:hypothetical protein